MAIPRKPKSGTLPPALETIAEASAEFLPASTQEAIAEAVKPATIPATEASAPLASAPREVTAQAMDYAADFQALVQQNTEKAVAEAQAAQERLRLAAEQSLEQTRAAYEKLKSAAEEATASLETSYAAATRCFTEFNQKAFGLLKAQAEANFEHVKAVMSAKSMPEVMDLQTSHLKRSFETANEQFKDLASHVKKVATDAGEPIKAVFGKRFAA